jgi:hypothetical protein
MQQSNYRIGNITSSECAVLLSTGTREMTEDELKEHKLNYPQSKKKTIEDGFGQPAIKYINQCNMERRLGRSLDSDIDTKPVNWGNFVELLLFSLLDEDYTYNSQDTLVHPEIKYWAGTPDGFKKTKVKTVVDAKCPFTLESFCKLINPLYDGLTGIDAMLGLRDGYIDKNGLFHPPHQDGNKFYWQLVSNACITGCTHAELIIYCPYESELDVIKRVAIESGNPSLYFIANSDNKSLPYLIDDGFYKNINIINFEVPVKDKERLTDAIKKAGKYLLNV